MNDAPLPPDHGAPVRLFVPGYYGCTCIKWVDRIEAVGADAPATSRMTEFASRTEQAGSPALALDFAPAVIDAAAMPIRVAKWRSGSRIRYRVVGLVWGRAELARDISVKLGDQVPVPAARCRVDVDGAPAGGPGWGLWTADVVARKPGVQALRCAIGDPGVRTRRLDRDYYLREVHVDEV